MCYTYPTLTAGLDFSEVIMTPSGIWSLKFKIRLQFCKTWKWTTFSHDALHMWPHFWTWIQYVIYKVIKDLRRFQVGDKKVICSCLYSNTEHWRNESGMSKCCVFDEIMTSKMKSWPWKRIKGRTNLFATSTLQSWQTESMLSIRHSDQLDHSLTSQSTGNQISSIGLNRAYQLREKSKKPQSGLSVKRKIQKTTRKYSF